ncbi:MAG: SDR family oxidoreductase, partial [candidate division Zixibacteria bacterium]
MDLENKRIIITGASKGIGRAIAESLAAFGAKLFLTARDQDQLESLKAELISRGCDLDFAVADLRDADQVSSMFQSAIEFLGGIDVLINNAGLGIKADVADMSLADWDRTMQVNLRAVFLLSQLASKKMIAQRSGYIINIGSGASQTPISGFASYCASKYGLLGFSESLGLELRGHNIKVSIILPGST